MIFSQLVWTALLGGLVPSTVITSSALATEATYSCRNMDPKFKNHKFSLKWEQVNAAMKAATDPTIIDFQGVNDKKPNPKEIRKLPKLPTKSGYPHVFENKSKMKWPNQRCNPGFHGPNILPVYEYPVLLGDKQVYKRETGKSAQSDPGPARAIFMIPDGTISPDVEFCGLISHELGNDEFFSLCDRV